MKKKEVGFLEQQAKKYAVFAKLSRQDHESRTSGLIQLKVYRMIIIGEESDTKSMDSDLESPHRPTIPLKKGMTKKFI